MIGWVLVGAGLMVALCAAAILMRFHGWFWPWLRGTLGLVVVLAGLLVAAAGWNTLQWHQVSANQPLYTLTLDREGDDAWRVSISGEGEGAGSRVVSGDRLEIRGRLLVLEAPLGGMETSMLYRTESVRGHGFEVRELVRFRTEGARSGAGWLDLWRWERALPLPLVRAESLYPLLVPMVDGAVFDVILQGNQLVGLPANTAAEEALERME